MRYIKINGTEYPFRFGQRELQTISSRFAGLSENGQGDEDGQSEQIQYDKIGQRMAESFDLFLKAFHTACKKGCRIHRRNNDEEIQPLSEIQLEDAIDENPGLYETLFDAFNESQIVKHYEEGQEEDTGKKPKA